MRTKFGYLRSSPVYIKSSCGYFRNSCGYFRSSSEYFRKSSGYVRNSSGYFRNSSGPLTDKEAYATPNVCVYIFPNIWNFAALDLCKFQAKIGDFRILRLKHAFQIKFIESSVRLRCFINILGFFTRNFCIIHHFGSLAATTSAVMGYFWVARAEIAVPHHLQTAMGLKMYRDDDDDG